MRAFKKRRQNNDDESYNFILKANGILEHSRS